MDIIKDILTDQNFLGAILSSLVFIFLGFILRYKGIINEHGKSVLNVVTLKIAIPCMAFCAFRSDFSKEAFQQNILILVFDILFYVLFIGLGILIFFRLGKTKRIVYSILMAVGQLSLYSMPILEAVYGAESGVLIPVSRMSIAFRLATYVYAYVRISGEKRTKKTILPTLKSIFLNPVRILRITGFVFWVIQNSVWQVKVGENSYGFVRIDKTLPALYKVLQTGKVMATPLARLLIGVTLGECNIVTAIKNKRAWFIAFLRRFFVPIAILGICLLLKLGHVIDFNEISLAARFIGNAAPVGAVVAVYCVDYKKEDYVASDAVFLSTIRSIISIPICFILVKLCRTLPRFAA